MKVSATAKYIRHSTRKTRLVTRAIIGRPVEEAASLLRFMPQGAATRRGQGAQERHGQRREQPRPVAPRTWSSSRPSADEGPTIKRWKPRAQGRAFPIHKPMTHITVVVENRED